MSEPHEALPNPDTNPALPLVREGWRHLQLQRPLAAWASWQRALRWVPDDPAALRALDAFENAAELPASARAVYRFRTPADTTLRARWDVRLRGQSLGELDAAADAFAALTNENPADADAWYNLALCRAWLGQNSEAVACLDRVVSLLAGNVPDRAAEAWVLAEVLRQGGGAEPLADDVRYAWVIETGDATWSPADLVRRWPNLVPLAMPVDPLTGTPPIADGEVFEWLDRTPSASGPVSDRAEDVPRVLASVIVTPRLVRASSPDPTGFERLDDPACAGIAGALYRARREKTPLPIAWADAAVGTFRLPAGLDDAAMASLTRSVVEHYLENLWVRHPRHALGGLSPLAAARAATRGDVIARAKLVAVIDYREQFAARSTHAALYQGYPFDRLRRRLGLLPGDGSLAFDPADASCMSERELDGLDPAALDNHQLVDAVSSSAPLGDDARTAHFAAPLARQRLLGNGMLDPASVFGPLVREALRLGDPDAALDWLNLAPLDAQGHRAQKFAVWSAEILARIGRPDDALRAYEELLARPEADAALALDGAETLLDNGHAEHARTLLAEARTRAAQSADREIEHRVESLLGRLDS